MKKWTTIRRKKKPAKKRKIKLLAGTTISELTSRFELSWTHHDNRKDRQCECYFCGCVIYGGDIWFNGTNNIRGSYVMFNACSKCALAAGLVW